MLVRSVWPKRRLRLSLFLFILFLDSSLWQVFPSFCSPAHLSVLLPKSFSYQFLLVYFSLQVCAVHQCLFFSSSRSLLNTSCILLIQASILFLRSWIILSLLWILFQNCLLPLRLSNLVDFYLAPFVTHVSDVSCCLTWSICGLLSTGCRVAAPPLLSAPS